MNIKDIDDLDRLPELILLFEKHDLYWEMSRQDCGQCLEIKAYEIHEIHEIMKPLMERIVYCYKRCSNISRAIESFNEFINENYAS